MSTELKWILYICGGFALSGFVYLLLKKNNINPESEYNKPTLRVNTTTKIRIAQKLNDFFDEYKKEWKQNRLINYYSRQFDIDIGYEFFNMKLKRISSIYDLDISDEFKAKRELLKLIEKKFNAIPKNDDIYKLLFLYQNILETESELEILNEIKEKVGESEVSRFNRYKEKLENKMDEIRLEVLK